MQPQSICITVTFATLFSPLSISQLWRLAKHSALVKYRKLEIINITYLRLEFEKFALIGGIILKK